MSFDQMNPDDRSDNVEKLRGMIKNTIDNIEEAQSSLLFSNETEQQRIHEKNKKREDSIASMRNEIKEEAAANQNNDF